MVTLFKRAAATAAAFVALGSAAAVSLPAANAATVKPAVSQSAQHPRWCGWDDYYCHHWGYHHWGYHHWGWGHHWHHGW